MAKFIPAIYPEPAMVFVAPGDPAPTPPTTYREVKPKDPATGFSLEELYEYTNGGPIEISNFPDGTFMVSNENAKIDALPVNVEATILYRQAWSGVSAWAAADTICGDALLCEAGEVQ